MRLNLLSSVAALTVLIALPACGGGGGGGGSSLAPQPTATATTAAGTPTITSTGETFPGASQPPISVGGYAFRITVAPATAGLPASGGASATLDYSLQPSFGEPTYNGSGQALLYFGLQIDQSQAVTFSAEPGFTVTLPSSAGSGPYYIAKYDPTQPSASYTAESGPIPASGGSVSLPGNSTSTNYAGNQLYVYVLHT